MNHIARLCLEHAVQFCLLGMNVHFNGASGPCLLSLLYSSKIEEVEGEGREDAVHIKCLATPEH